MSDLTERLRSIATAKEAVDFSYGRKSPLYGRETEVEWMAADALEAQEARIKQLEDALRRVQKRISEPLPDDERSDLDRDLIHARSICKSALTPPLK